MLGQFAHADPLAVLITAATIPQLVCAPTRPALPAQPGRKTRVKFLLYLVSVCFAIIFAYICFSPFWS